MARAGRLLAGLAVWVGSAILLSALLGPPLFAGVDALSPGHYPFVRVLRRLAQLIALLGLIGWMRRLGVRGVADLGLGWSSARRSDLLRGLAWGAVAVVPAFGWELAAGNRTPSLAQLSPGQAAQMVAAAGAIGLVEEGVCRGALLFPFVPLQGAALAVANVGVSSLYSIVHFARGGGKVTEVDTWSGFRVWSKLPLAVGEHLEAAIGLFLTGALLYLLAAKQGHAWGAVGVHAGAVAMLQLLGAATEPVAGRDALFFVDGILPGWGLSIALAAAIGWLILRRR